MLFFGFPDLYNLFVVVRIIDLDLDQDLDLAMDMGPDIDTDIDQT